MKVLGARCIIKEEKVSDTTPTGIMIPGQKDFHTNRGTVIAVGEGARLDNGKLVPMGVNIGDKVAYANFAGAPIVDEDDEQYIVLNERDILCVFDKN